MWRAQRADYARIPSELRFRFGHKSFYRFGIHSCLATSHKQIINKDAKCTSSCILGFQATRPATFYSSSVYCSLANRKVYLRQITVGCKHNSAQLDKWKSLPWKVYHRKNSDLNFSETTPSIERPI